MTDTVRYELEGAIATITLNRPEARNALTAEMQDGLLAALRGDPATAEAILAGLGDLRTREDMRTKSLISLVEAAAAAGRRQYEAALRHARGTLVYADVLGVSAEDQRWSWAVAARAAYELADFATVRELLSLLDSNQPGQIAPML